MQITRNPNHRPLVLVAGLLLCLTACTQQPGSWPISNGAHRATPLHFGMYVTPDSPDNPIKPPERFIGYHVGTDFEITPQEQTIGGRLSGLCAGSQGHRGLYRSVNCFGKDWFTVDELVRIEVRGYSLSSRKNPHPPPSSSYA